MTQKRQNTSIENQSRFKIKQVMTSHGVTTKEGIDGRPQGYLLVSRMGNRQPFDDGIPGNH